MQTIDFVKKHPIAAGATFVGTGAVAAGVTHSLLDLERPYAFGVGAAAGLGGVAAAAYIDSWLEEAKKLPKKLWEGTKELAEDAGKAVVEGVEAAGVAVADNGGIQTADAINETIYRGTGIDLGGTQETAKFDNQGNQTTGQHQLDTQAEKDAMARYLIGGQRKEDLDAFYAAIAASHRKNAPPPLPEPPSEPLFIDNKENPKAVEEQVEQLPEPEQIGVPQASAVHSPDSAQELLAYRAFLASPTDRNRQLWQAAIRATHG